MSMLVQKYDTCEKDYTWGSSKCSCENEKYLGSIIDKSKLYLHFY